MSASSFNSSVLAPRWAQEEVSSALAQNSILAQHPPPFSASPDSVAFFALQVLNSAVQLDMFDNMPIYEQPFTLGMRKHVSDAIDSVVDLLHHQGLREAPPHIFGYFQQASLLPPGSHYAYFVDLHNKRQEAQRSESPCYIPQSPVSPDYSPSSTGATLGYANEPILGLSMLPATPPSSPDLRTGLSIAQLGYAESALGANPSHESPHLNLDAHVAHAVQYAAYEDIKGFVNENDGLLSFGNLHSPALPFRANDFASFSESSSMTLPELETASSSPVSDPDDGSEWDLPYPSSLESCSNMRSALKSLTESGLDSENKTSYFRLSSSEHSFVKTEPIDDAAHLLALQNLPPPPGVSYSTLNIITGYVAQDNKPLPPRSFSDIMNGRYPDACRSCIPHTYVGCQHRDTLTSLTMSEYDSFCHDTIASRIPPSQWPLLPSFADSFPQYVEEKHDPSPSSSPIISNLVNHPSPSELEHQEAISVINDGRAKTEVWALVERFLIDKHRILPAELHQTSYTLILNCVSRETVQDPIDYLSFQWAILYPFSPSLVQEILTIRVTLPVLILCRCLESDHPIPPAVVPPHIAQTPDLPSLTQQGH
ncbi:hypothetical protein C8J56DRAFT_895257 [Mycena floridula]|nr:hypothetical protein C8J56DRAFT_895257 [Mycena floridula]